MRHLAHIWMWGTVHVPAFFPNLMEVNVYSERLAVILHTGSSCENLVWGWEAQSSLFRALIRTYSGSLYHRLYGFSPASQSRDSFVISMSKSKTKQANISLISAYASLVVRISHKKTLTKKVWPKDAEIHDLRSSNTRSSSNMERLDQLPGIRCKSFSTEETFRSKLERILEECVVVVKSPMPWGHNSLEAVTYESDPLLKAHYLHLEARSLHQGPCHHKAQLVVVHRALRAACAWSH
jgi:hypothetical protein